MFQVLFNMIIILAVLSFMALANCIFYNHKKNALNNRNYPGHSTKRAVSKLNANKLHGVAIKKLNKRNSSY